MELRGLKYIDANDYYSLMIRDTEKGLKVNAQGDMKYQTIKSSFPISLELDRNDEEKTKNELVSYFLRNNKINMIEDNLILSRYDGKFLGALSGDKGLYLQIKKNDNSIDIAKKILDKYIIDRYQTVFNEEDVVIYKIDTADKSSYRVYEVNGEKRVEITLKRKPHSLDIVQIEKEFLEEFISEKLSMIDEVVELKRKKIYFTHFENFLDQGRTFDTKKFSIIIKDDKLVEIFYNLIYTHNINIEENKKLQLKLKGF